MKANPDEHPRGSAILVWLLTLTVIFVAPLTVSRAADSSVLRIKLRAKAPNFDLAAPDGKRVKLSDFAGHNVLVDFYRGYW